MARNFRWPLRVESSYQPTVGKNLKPQLYSFKELNCEKLRELRAAHSPMKPQVRMQRQLALILVSVPLSKGT